MKRIISTKDGDTPVTFVLDKIDYFELHEDENIVYIAQEGEGVGYNVDCGSSRAARMFYEDLKKAFYNDAKTEC